MSRVIIDDIWLSKDAPTRIRRALSKARDPFKANVPEQYRLARYGRGKRWSCRWFQPTAQGKIAKRKAFDKLEEAQEFQAAMEDDIRRGRYHDPQQENRILADIAEEWLSSKVDIRQSTHDRYQRELNQYILPTFATTPIGAITPRDVQDFITKLQDGSYTKAATRKHKARPLSARSIRSIVKIVFSGIFEYALQNQWIVSNPTTNAHVPKPVKRELTILTPKQVHQIADAVGNIGTDTDRVIVLFQAFTGARIDETLALKISDINFTNATARISHTWSTTAKGYVLMPPKNGKPRTIAIPQFLIKDLESVAGKRERSEFLFLSHMGKAIDVRNWRMRVWYPALKAAGFDKNRVTIHSLRHTYASMAIASGADVKTLQKQLGHSSASITLDVYTDLWPNSLATVAQKISDFAVSYE